MSLPISGLSAAYQAIRDQTRAFENAGKKVSEAFTTEAGEASSEAQEAIEPARGSEQGEGLPGRMLTDSMVNILLAQRALTAAIRMAQKADQVSRQAIGLADPRQTQT